MRHTSVWIDTGPESPALPRLERSIDADVAVLGGGIVGITTALLLKEAGVRVVLLEADRLARGVSGYTTAKVSSQHGMIYARLRSTFGADGARAYGAANEAALAWIADRVEQDGIDCDFRRRASYAYLGPGSSRSDAEREAEAALEAGLPASLVEDTPLPYPVAAAVRFDDQAEFHVRRYLLGLAEQLDEVYEHSHAVQVDADERCTVKTPGGSVTADHVVVATHYPVPRPRARLRAREPAAFLRAALPDRGRAAAGHVHERRLADALDPCRARRRRGAAARRRRGPQDRRGRGHRGVLPHARALRPRALGGRVRGVPVVLPGRHDDRRRPLCRGAHAAQRAGADGDRIRQVGHDRWHRGGDDPVRPAARSREPVGRAVQPQPHQAARRRQVPRGEREGRPERSWDCPCHGSRFAPDGEVLQGPAVHRLETKPVD